MRTIVLILSLMLAYVVHAQANGQYGKPEVYDISYEYELISKYQCPGTLSLKAIPPDGADRIVLQRTRNYLTDAALYNKITMVTAKSWYDVDDNNSEIHIVREDVVGWGCFFQVAAVYDENNTWIFGDIYCTTDFLSQEDRETLFGDASIEEAESNPVKITSEGGNLIVNTTESIQLSAYTPAGICLFSGEINGHSEIPVNASGNRLLIVRYSIGNDLLTKKIIAK